MSCTTGKRHPYDVSKRVLNKSWENEVQPVLLTPLGAGLGLGLRDEEQIAAQYESIRTLAKLRSHPVYTLGGNPNPISLNLIDPNPNTLTLTGGDNSVHSTPALGPTEMDDQVPVDMVLTTP